LWGAGATHLEVVAGWEKGSWEPAAPLLLAFSSMGALCLGLWGGEPRICETDQREMG
jgi:hypothetical protein